MLIQLHIQNLVTIQELHLDFQAGTTVITGETGTGKSIIIDAIELALGNRATSDIIRPGQEKTDISIGFNVNQLPKAGAWLKNYDLDQAAGECIIRRMIHRDGRSRSFINGMPTTLQPLRELSELLIQIHGQHEHLALLKSDIQRNLLDHYAGHENLVAEVHTASDEWHRLEHQIVTLQQSMAQQQVQSAFLKYQLNELESLNLEEDEFSNLDNEHKQLTHAEELLQHLNQALTNLTEQEGINAVYCLHQALQALEIIEKVNPIISTWVTSIKNVMIELNEVEDGLRLYLDTTQLNPGRLLWLEQRISTLFDLARKHKIAPQELLGLQHKILNQYNELENRDLRLTELIAKRQQLENNYFALAKKLSLSRQQAANKLAKKITQLIHTLSFPHAEFCIFLENELPESIAPFGLEKIIFRLKTNLGQPLQPLAKIASGGELSRIGLAIYLATAGEHAVPTLIFDEVDVGIGGSTAEIVGKLLRCLGNAQQVLCITHQPQVAAQGHKHLCVKKVMQNETTMTHIHYLSPQEKVRELARMLGGIEITRKTLAHAQEMIEMSNK